MLERLRTSVSDSVVKDKNGYPYFIHPVTDGIPRMDPELLSEIIDSLISIGDFNCDVIVCPESMGIHLAAPVSLRLGIPYSVIRKRGYGLPGEVSVAQSTGYSDAKLFINGIGKGDRVVILDDVLSTGGTMRAMVNAFKDTIGADVVDTIVVFDKSEVREELSAELEIPIKALLKVSVKDGRVVID